MLKAKEHETARDHALRQDPWFDYGEGMLQIAIVLLSVSMIGAIPAMFYVGTFLGSLGFLATLNGFSWSSDAGFTCCGSARYSPAWR